MRRFRLFPFVVVLLLGCNRQQHVPRHIVILFDTSASIEPEAQKDCIAAILRLVQETDRGDRVSLIPITSDAAVESTGRVLRFQKPIERSAYDADLIRFNKDVDESLRELQTRIRQTPAYKTDIFGGIHMALEEFESSSGKNRQILIIFSDLIEDDDIFSFQKDSRFNNEISAIKFANNLSLPRSYSKKGHIAGYLGLLRSNEFGRLNKLRRTAIESFWQHYLERLDMDVSLVSDGLSIADKICSP